MVACTAAKSRRSDVGSRVEDDAPGRRGREHTVEHHTVKVQVGIERRAEAVDEGHRPEARRRTRTRTVRPQALLHQLRRPLRGEALLADESQGVLGFVEANAPAKRYEYAVLAISAMSY